MAENEEKTEYRGFCMGCRAKGNEPKNRKILNPKAVEIKKGTWAVKGTCEKCGTNMFKIVGKEKPKL